MPKEPVVCIIVDKVLYRTRLKAIADFVVYERVNALVPLIGRYRTYMCKNSSCDGLKSFNFTAHCIPPLMGRCPLENGIYGLLKGSPIFEKVLVLVQNTYVCLIIGGQLTEHSIQNPPRLIMLMEGSPST